MKGKAKKLKECLRELASALESKEAKFSLGVSSSYLALELLDRLFGYDSSFLKSIGCSPPPFLDKCAHASFGYLCAEMGNVLSHCFGRKGLLGKIYPLALATGASVLKEVFDFYTGGCMDVMDVAAGLGGLFSWYLIERKRKISSKCKKNAPAGI